MPTSRPAPDPSAALPTSGRLEDVRNNQGISRREFWMRLGDLRRWTDDEGKGHEAVTWKDPDGLVRSISYPAIRGYHYDREPPAWYLTRVCQVFSVNLPWLAERSGPRNRTDEHIAAELATAQQEADVAERRKAVEVGAAELDMDELEEAERLAEHERMTHQNEGLDRVVEAAMADAERRERRDAGIADDPLLASNAVRALFGVAWTRLAEACPDPDPSPEELNAVGRVLLAQLRAPLEAWGFAHDLPSDDRRYEDYALAMLHALTLAAASTGQGDPVRLLEDNGRAERG